MSARKPLVLNNGEIEQLQSSDTLDAVVSEVDIISLVAAATITIGNPVYLSSANGCNKAQANAVSTAKVIGLAKAGITSGSSGSVQTDGIITLTTGEWDAIAGTTGGLTFNTDYFLSAAASGAITATVPEGTNYIVKIGRAISTLSLDLNISSPIKL